MILANAYYDESWTRDGRGIAAIAGYVAPAEVWEAVEKSWQPELDLLNINTFHMSDCIGAEGHGEFRHLDLFQRQALIHRLSLILSEAEIQPVWSAVVREAWDNEVTASYLVRVPTPFSLCFEDIIQQTYRWAQGRQWNERTVPMFAHQPEHADWMAEISRAYGVCKHYKEFLGPIAFGSPSQVVPLQTADFLVYLMAWHWDAIIFRSKLPPPEITFRKEILEHATRHGGLDVGGCWDTDALKALMVQYQETGAII